jgi:hypothetical protein
VNDYTSLYNWIVIQLCGSYCSTGNYNAGNVWKQDDKIPYVKNLKHALDSQGVDYSSWLKIYTKFNSQKNQTISYIDPDLFYQYFDKKRKNEINFKFVSSVRMIMNRVQEADCTTNNMVKSRIISNLEICMKIFHDDSTAEKDFNFIKIDPRIIFDKSFIPYMKSMSQYKTSKEAGVSFNVRNYFKLNNLKKIKFFVCLNFAIFSLN